MASIGPELPPVIQYPAGFAVFNNKNDTAFNEYYEIKTGADDNMKDYYLINKWGESDGELWDDLTPAYWWTANGSYQGSNSCNMLKGKAFRTLARRTFARVDICAANK